MYTHHFDVTIHSSSINSPGHDPLVAGSKKSLWPLLSPLQSTQLMPPLSRKRLLPAPSMLPANASSLLSSSSTSQLLSGGHASPTLASMVVQLTRKAGGIVKHKPCPSHCAPPTYLTDTLTNFDCIVQEATGCPIPASSGVHRQAAAALDLRCPLPPPTVSMFPTLDVSMFLPNHASLVPTRGLEHKSSSGGTSLTMAATSAAREAKDDSWLFQELEAMTYVSDFLSDAFPNHYVRNSNRRSRSETSLRMCVSLYCKTRQA
jgi:hypothetical protein